MSAPQSCVQSYNVPSRFSGAPLSNVTRLLDMILAVIYTLICLMIYTYVLYIIYMKHNIYIYNIYIYIYIYKPLHSHDYLKKIPVKTNVATEEGNSRNEIGH